MLCMVYVQVSRHQNVQPSRDHAEQFVWQHPYNINENGSCCQFNMNSDIRHLYKWCKQQCLKIKYALLEDAIAFPQNTRIDKRPTGLDALQVWLWIIMPPLNSGHNGFLSQHTSLQVMKYISCKVPWIRTEQARKSIAQKMKVI